MAVLRQEVNTRIDAKDTRTVADVAIQDARVQPNQTVRVGDSTSWRTNLVDSIAGTVVRVGEKTIGVAQENAYLEGQAKAGRIKSEEELEGNWLTKDWAIAGYRDTMGKLSLADSEARMNTDMQELRTQGPAAMEAYLAKRREELTPTFASLSREARANMFGQLLLSDRSAIMKHAGEHKAYILDTAQKGIKATVLSGATGLTQLQVRAALSGTADDGQAYASEVQRFAGNIETSVWRNPMFKNEPGIKSKLTAEAIQHALDNDHLSVYEYFRDNAFEGVDGGPKRSVLADLDEGAALKLGKSYLEAKQRNMAAREGALITQKAQVEASFANGTFNGSWDDVQALTNRMVVAKLVDAKGAEAFQQAYFTMRGKGDYLESDSMAFIKNDSQYAANRGKSQQELGDALEKSWAKQALNGKPVPISSQIGTLFDAVKNGNPVAGKMLGARVGPSLMQLARPDGTMDAQHTEIVNTFAKMYDTADQTRRVAMLEGLDKTQSARFQMMREAMRTDTVDGAIRKVMAIEERNSKVTPQELAMMSQVKDKEILDEVNDFDSQGLLMSIKNTLLPTKRNALKAELQPDDRLWGNSTRIDDYRLKVRSEIQAEASALRQVNPAVGAEGLVNMAAANVTKRTLRTEHGPLILPRDVDPNKFFGVAPSIPKEVIAKSIDKVAAPSTKGNAISYEVGMGGVFWKEYDAQGNPTTKGGLLDPKSVAKGVDELMQIEVKRSSEIHGSGKTVRHDTASVNFNGENTAGVPSDLMFKFRDNLVQHEGVRNTVYKDTKGNPTVGVGIANKAYWPKVGPDGKVGQDEINSSFRKASSDAAMFGARAQEKLGLQNSESAFLLFSEFAYQGRGGSFTEFAQALGARDKEAALKALEGTKAYQYSADSRKNHYKKLTLAVLEGK